MTLSFLDRYNQSKTWQERVMVMEIYYYATKDLPEFKLKWMARYFDVSIGLVSENLKLADAIHRDERFLKIESRNQALKELK